MSTLFISDLHLSASQPELSRIFCQFLTEHAARADALYILGDLFDAWIGDDDHTAFSQQIINALAGLGSLKRYLIVGNRDFLLGPTFLAATGLTLLPDPCVIDLYGQPTLLSHGDLLCTHDRHYQRFRGWVHQRWLQKIFLSLPLGWRRKLARQLRKQSQDYTQQTALTLQDVNEETVQYWFKRYPTQLLIHGHTHRPGIHTLQADQHSCKRIVLGAWHDGGNVLICSSDGNIKLVDF